MFLSRQGNALRDDVFLAVEATLNHDVDWVSDQIQSQVRSQRARGRDYRERHLHPAPAIRSPVRRANLSDELFIGHRGFIGARAGKHFAETH